jgi:hypothetical protein
MELRDVRDGRAGRGSVYQCWHGDRATSQVIVDWRPLQRISTRDTTKLGGGTFTFPVEYLLEATAAGTRFTQRCAAPDAVWPARAIMKRLFPVVMSKQFQLHIEAFGTAIEQAYGREVNEAAPGS